MSLGSTTISWRSCKQLVPTYSTTEAEYVAKSKATKGNCVAQKNTWRFIGEIGEFHSSFSRQYFCNQVGQESQVSWLNQTYQHKVSFDLISCRSQGYSFETLFHTWASCRHSHQSTYKRKVWKVQNDAWTHQHPFDLRGGMLNT